MREMMGNREGAIEVDPGRNQRPDNRVDNRRKVLETELGMSKPDTADTFSASLGGKDCTLRTVERAPISSALGHTNV